MSTPGNTKDPTLSIVIYGGRRVAVQRGYNGVRVIIRKLKSTGQRVALFYEPCRTRQFRDAFLPGIVPDYVVPVEILGLCVGRKDAWKRRISFKCASCGTRHAAENMDGEICPDCAVVDEFTAAEAVKKEMDNCTLMQLDREHMELVRFNEARHARLKAEAEAAQEARRQAVQNGEVAP